MADYSQFASALEDLVATLEAFGEALRDFDQRLFETSCTEEQLDFIGELNRLVDYKSLGEEQIGFLEQVRAIAAQHGNDQAEEED